MMKKTQVVTIQQSQRVAVGTRVLEVKRSLLSQQVKGAPRKEVCFQAATMNPLLVEMHLRINCLYHPVKVPLKALCHDISSDCY